MKTQMKIGFGMGIVMACLIHSGSGAIAIALAPDLSMNILSGSTSAIAMATSLETTIWQIQSYRNAAGDIVTAVVDRPATLQFEGGRLSGTTGCNRFFGAYTLDEDALTLQPGGSTLMACFPEALAQQEDTLLGQFSQVTGYRLDADQLTLLNDAGTVLMTLQPQPQAELVGTLWQLTAYNNGRGGVTSLLADTEITATFDADQRLSGSAGCNTYQATYETMDHSLSIGPALSTRKACEESILTQELAYLNALQATATYSIQGDRLELKSADGSTQAIFVAAPSP